MLVVGSRVKKESFEMTDQVFGDRWYDNVPSKFKILFPVNHKIEQATAGVCIS